MTENNSRYPLVRYVAELQEEMPELDSAVNEALLHDKNEEECFIGASHNLCPTMLRF